MPNAKKGVRSRQKQRTRKDLLNAATRLLKEGRKPSLEDVAEEALVSRATAYRYFPSVESLLLEATLDVATPDATELFGSQDKGDPLSRLEKVDKALEKMIVSNEPALRVMLARSLERPLDDGAKGNVPIRQNRRTALIEAALEPVRNQFKSSDLDKLSKAIALIVGSESWVVFNDVLQISPAEARKVKRWMMRVLVDAALTES